MRRVDKLLAIARARAGVSSYTASSGVPHSLALQAINDAQDHLQAVMTSIDSGLFIRHKEISVVADQETYSLPNNLFINNKIVSVEYSGTGREEDYEPLIPKTFAERTTQRDSAPQFYIRSGNTIYLNPVPSSAGNATIRVTYYYELDDLDTRRGGAITARTLAAGQLTALTIDASGLSAPNKDAIELADADYISIVSRLGVVQMAQIPITGFNSTTGVFTLAAHTYDTGETAAVGDYVVIGRHATTHSALPDNCERYLVTYTQKRLLQKASSTDSLEEDAELLKIENDIITSMAKPTEDVSYVPVLDDEAMF